MVYLLSTLVSLNGRYRPLNDTPLHPRTSRETVCQCRIPVNQSNQGINLLSFRSDCPGFHHSYHPAAAALEFYVRIRPPFQCQIILRNIYINLKVIRSNRKAYRSITCCKSEINFVTLHVESDCNL